MLVRCNPKLDAVLNGQVEVREIVARRVAVRATRDAKGNWSIGALAHLPTLGGNSLPKVRLENSTLEIVDDSQAPPRLFTLRDINVEITPVGAGTKHSRSPKLKLVASLSSDYLHRTLIHGAIAPETGRWALESQQVRVEITPALRASLPVEFSRGFGMLEGLSARSDLRFRASGGPQEPIQFEVAGRIHDGRIDDPRFALSAHGHLGGISFIGSYRFVRTDFRAIRHGLAGGFFATSSGAPVALCRAGSRSQPSRRSGTDFATPPRMASQMEEISTDGKGERFL